MRRIILTNYQSPGDLVMLSAAVRDLHLSYPGEFLTDVRTSCDALFDHNPRITRLDENDPDVGVIECHYPLIHHSDRSSLHFIHGFLAFLNDTLDLAAWVHEFKGDVYLSEEERERPSPLAEHSGRDDPYWVVCAGGKNDYTIKWWDAARYQRVVDHFEGRIRFVQVGASEHYHPTLRGVLDLRGKTDDMRELVRVVYHAQGVLCGVSLPMHLAPAVETRPDRPPNRACVVVAGGREPAHWEQYPFHQFIHTMGQLACCESGGCWRSRTKPLGDGEEHDQEDSLCADVVDGLPRCMHMITPEMVIQRIEGYFVGGALEYVVEETCAHSPAPPSLQAANAPDPAAPLTEETALPRAEAFIKEIPPFPGGYEGRGITICGGGLQYFTGAWVCINMLRKLGCSLPIELWYLGPREISEEMARLVTPLGVTCVDAQEVRKTHPARILNGWEVKSYSIEHSRFREVLALDADNVPVKDPTYLFDSAPYRETGAVFWPDFGRLAPDRDVWRICGVAYRDEPEHETGQILIDKLRCWEPLRLARFYNDNSDFYYNYILGDKDTYHMAFHKLGRPYAMPERPIYHLAGLVMCQHDFEGERLFQHRNFAKWRLSGGNNVIEGFQYAEECEAFLEELRAQWDGRFPGQNRFDGRGDVPPPLRALADELVATRYIYRRVGHDERPMAFDNGGCITEGSAGCEIFWNLKPVDHAALLEISSDADLTCRLVRSPDGTWKGRWLNHERMPVELVPLGKTAKRGGRQVIGQ